MPIINKSLGDVPPSPAIPSYNDELAGKGKKRKTRRREDKQFKLIEALKSVTLGIPRGGGEEGAN